jgi:glycosyltransferase involved in cell wall biosynthesis
MTSPKISIIIATYNSAATLDRCLLSIESQSFKNFEIIVVDGLSNDETVDIIRMHAKHIAYWHSLSDRGVYDAWNQGIAKSRGEYICFIGSDDFYSGEDALMNVFQKIGVTDYDLISSKGLFHGAGGTHVFGGPWDYRKVARRITICHPGLIHHRTLFDRFGNFNTEYRITGDYEFLLRLPKEISTLHVDAVTIEIADGGISRSRYMHMLKEKRRAQSSCPRIGPMLAWLNYLDKLWRIPIAKALKIPY